jgi:hypothetical protein
MMFCAVSILGYFVLLYRVSKKKLTPLLFKLAAKVSVFFYSSCTLSTSYLISFYNPPGLASLLADSIWQLFVEGEVIIVL